MPNLGAASEEQLDRKAETAINIPASRARRANGGTTQAPTYPAYCEEEYRAVVCPLVARYKVLGISGGR